MGKCRDCYFWRDKGWNGDKGIGICDNSIVIKQVKMMSVPLLLKFVPDKRDANMINQSIRFNADFGCNHFKPFKS